MKKFFLELVVFICGAVVMAYEIIGSRMLGPHVGTSIYVWTSIIGVILFSLSLGYFWGGKIADKKPSYQLLALVIAVSGVLIFLSSIYKNGLITFLLSILDDLKIVSIIASLFLFSLPAILLGMVSPFAARLKIKNVKTSGNTVGNLYALSTVGSIVGTFGAGFFLIPGFKITSILYVFALTLIVVAIGLYSVYYKISNNSQID